MIYYISNKKERNDILKKIISIFLVLVFFISSTISISALDKGFIDETLNIEKKLLPFNYEVGTIIKPEYIVIHETGGYGKGIDSERIYSYWNRDPEAKASTHFIVDENKTIQLLELDWLGWHVGDNEGYSNISNRNSIGIEICVNSDGDYITARARAIRLVKYLMQELNIDNEHVVRHFDASGKGCPEIMIRFPWLWDDFKYQISQPDKIIDGIYKEVEVLEETVNTNRYLHSNNLVESKIVLKKYNVSSFLWSLLKNYPLFNDGNSPIKENRIILNLDNSNYSFNLGSMSAEELSNYLLSESKNK